MFQASDKENLRSKLANDRTRIQDMNEYCLIEIFSQPSLDLLDLCALAETCQQFRRIVKRVAPADIGFQANRHHRNWRVSSKNHPKRAYKREDVERILSNFNPILTAVAFDGFSKIDNDGVSLLHSLAANQNDGSNANLTNLALRHHIITPESNAVPLKQIFQKLEKLEMRTVYMSDGMTTLFSGMNSLVDLRISYMRFCGAVLMNTFPALERFEYRKTSIIPAQWTTKPEHEQSLECLTNFIARHSNLKEISLSFGCQNSSTQQILQGISNNCQELEKLSIDVIVDDHSCRPLVSMKSLRSLSLWGVQCTDFDFLASITHLREFTLLSISPNDTTKLSSLIHLTKLDIGFENEDSDIMDVAVIELISHLTNLEEIHLKGDFVLNERTFLKIVDIVRERPVALCMSCEIGFVLQKVCSAGRNVKFL